MPLLPLHAIWPSLGGKGLAAGVVSALFMAGAVYQLDRTLVELPTRRLPRIVITLAFAAHPMIVYYAGNGMSEGPFLFFLLMTARHLVAWSRSGDLSRGVTAGMALAGAYLTRYEAVGPAVGVVLAVVALTMWRTRGPLRQRAATAMCDAVIVGAPFLIAFVLWSAASWILVGSPFEQFSSQYGNSSQITLQHAAGVSFQATPMDVVVRLGVMEPLLVLACLAGAAVALRRRDPAGLAVAAVLVPELAFASLTYVTGMTFHWFRFFMAAVPLAALMLGVAMAEPPPAPRRRRLRVQRWHPPRWRTRLRPVGLALAAAVLLAPALPLAARAMADTRIAPEEANYLLPAVVHHVPTPNDSFTEERQVARYIDGMHLPDGSVLVDTFMGFAVVLNSTHPDQFVITSDRDFQSALADPAGTGLRYILVPRDVVLGSVDAISKQYPGLYRSGAGIATFVREFFDPLSVQDQAWRLYKVTPPASR
jgi:hypothetical protein